MQNPDRQQDTAVVDAACVGKITDAVHARAVDLVLDVVADQQVFVRAIGRYPFSDGLVMPLCCKPCEVSCAIGFEIAWIEVM